jgi:hypothetical protein
LEGGGDRSLGDTGQRGASLISDVRRSFWGVGAVMVSEGTGCKLGVVTADNALWVAAADGGLVGVLVDREGLVSCVLFFLDLPGPAVERVEVVGLTCGLIGDDSLEGTGELAVEVFRFDWSFFVVVTDDVDGSRAGFGVVGGGGGRTMEEPAAVASSIGSAVSCGAPEMEVKALSSIVT